MFGVTQVREAPGGTAGRPRLLTICGSGWFGPVIRVGSSSERLITGLFGDEMTRFSFCINVVACVHSRKWRSRLRVHASSCVSD